AGWPGWPGGSIIPSQCAPSIGAKDGSCSPRRAGVDRVTESSGTLTIRESTLAEWLAERGLHGLLASQDSDGDGMSNLDEYLARTDPLSGKSRFAVLLEPTAHSIRLTWPSFPGRTYRVQNSRGLEEFTQVGVPISGDGSEKSIDVPAAADGQPSFWR